MARLPSLLRSAGTIALACLLAACFTGERPSMSDAPSAPGTPTGDPAVDAVLERLDRANTATFTGDYEILTRYGGISSDAEVRQAAPNRRSITIGDVRFVIDGRRSTTCRTKNKRCVERADDAFVSDLQVTHRFYAEAAAANLRQVATRRVAEATASKDTIAGQQATCVTIEVSGGRKRFCALDTGVLALLDDAAVRVTLTSYSSRVDANASG